jgi:hypothetical protein
MKIIALHDARGNIERLVAAPAGGPPASVGGDANLIATELDAANLRIDLRVADAHERLVDLIKNYRVEVKREAKLVRRTGKR